MILWKRITRPLRLMGWLFLFSFVVGFIVFVFVNIFFSIYGDVAFYVYFYSNIILIALYLLFFVSSARNFSVGVEIPEIDKSKNGFILDLGNKPKRRAKSRGWKWPIYERVIIVPENSRFTFNVNVKSKYYAVISLDVDIQMGYYSIVDLWEQSKSSNIREMFAFIKEELRESLEECSILINLDGIIKGETDRKEAERLLIAGLNHVLRSQLIKLKVVQISIPETVIELVSKNVVNKAMDYPVYTKNNPWIIYHFFRETKISSEETVDALKKLGFTAAKTLRAMSQIGIVELVTYMKHAGYSEKEIWRSVSIFFKLESSNGQASCWKKDIVSILEIDPSKL